MPSFIYFLDGIDIRNLSRCYEERHISGHDPLSRGYANQPTVHINGSVLIEPSLSELEWALREAGAAFGGGGARGLAHVGVLRALRAHPRWLPSMVAGTSAGSIAAALYAAGIPQERIESAALKFNWFRHVIRLSHTVKAAAERHRGGLISNAMLAETVNSLIGNRGFDDLNIDLAVVAADLEHRRRVIFTSTRVAKRIRRRKLERFPPAPAEDRPGCETLIVSELSRHRPRRSLDLAEVGFQISGIDRRRVTDTGQRDLIDLGEQEMNTRLLELEQWPPIRQLSPGRRYFPLESRKSFVSP